MSPIGDTLDVALHVAAAIEDAGGAYFVGGSIASSIHGEPRSTNDIDFVVELPLGRLEEFRRRLGPDFEVDLDMLRDALRSSSSANAFHLPTVTKIDFFGRGYDGYDAMEFSRRRPVVTASGAPLIVKSPEDTILRKLLWYRMGGEVSERQWRDVVAVLHISASALDDAYLDLWAERLAIADLLGRARSAM